MTEKLPRTVESLEGIDETFHPFYSPVKEGDSDEPVRYDLSVEFEGLIPEDKVEGLQKNRDEILTELKKVKEKYRGVDPEEFKKLTKMQADLERERAMTKGDFKALEEQLREQHAQEVQGVNTVLSRYRDRIQDLMVTQVATAEIAAAKGRVNILLPHVQGQVRVIEEEEGSGQFAVEVLNREGRPRLNSKGNPMSIKELVEEMKDSDDFSILFEGSGATGGGANRSQGAAPSGAVVLKGEDRKNPQKYAAAKAEAEKRGVELVLQE